MTSISSLGGGWAAARPPDPSVMRQRMFERADGDGDGSGSVDATELKQVLAKASEMSGSDVGDADEMLKKWDSSGDGSLDADELDAGMKSLMPQPGSTMQFAQMHGMQGGMPPPPPPEDAEGSDGSSTSTDSAAGTDLKQLLQALAQAMDGNGDGNIGADELSGFLQKLQGGSVDTTA